MTPYTIDTAETDLRAAIDRNDEAAISNLGDTVDQLERKRATGPNLHASALWYAEQGLHVFPLQPGAKVPFKGSNGCKGATTDPDLINRWWTGNPAANIGIATGHLIDVVDIDGALGQKSRTQHWGDLFAAIDDDTIARVLTPRPGGMHLYVPATGDGNSAGIVPGVDYRGLGGYVVAPPSVNEQGAYRFLGAPRFATITRTLEAS